MPVWIADRLIHRGEDKEVDQLALGLLSHLVNDRLCPVVDLVVASLVAIESQVVVDLSGVCLLYTSRCV